MDLSLRKVNGNVNMNDIGDWKRVSLKQIGIRTWNDFVDNSRSGWLWNRYEMAKAMETWRYYQDASFGAVNNDRGTLDAIMSVQAVKKQRLDCLGGALIADDLTSAKRLEIERWLGEVLLETARKYKATEINFKYSPFNPGLDRDTNIINGVKIKRTDKQTWMIDLTISEKELWEQMEKRARNTVRKARNQGVVLREAKTQDEKVYYKLHSETYHRTGATPHPESYFHYIFTNMLKGGLNKIYFAEFNGKAIAAGNFGIYKNLAWYWTGASSKLGLQTGANSLIQWEAMTRLKSMGVQKIETGEAFFSPQDGKSKTISDFKKSFGGKLVSFYQVTFELPRSENLLNKMKDRISVFRSKK